MCCCHRDLLIVEIPVHLVDLAELAQAERVRAKTKR
jgi:hypothetical protein